MWALYRAGYILAMYTGARAAYNRSRNAFLTQPKAAVIDGQRRRLTHTAVLLIRVHARIPPHSLPPDRRAGMVSIKVASPGISRALYALLCVTSHFGCGHVEIAFYEENGCVVFYGLRNTLKANAERLGSRFLPRTNFPRNRDDEIAILNEVSRILESNGLKTSLAAPGDCVKLSVNDILLHPERRHKTMDSLQNLYARIWKRVTLHDH